MYMYVYGMNIPILILILPPSSLVFSSNYFLFQGYNTGYKYSGLSLLQSEPSAAARGGRVGEGVVQGGDEERGGEKQLQRGRRNRRRGWCGVSV